MSIRTAWISVIAATLVISLLVLFPVTLQERPQQEALPHFWGVQKLTDEEIENNIKKDFEYRMMVMEATLFPRLVMEAMIQSGEAKAINESPRK